MNAEMDHELDRAIAPHVDWESLRVGQTVRIRLPEPWWRIVAEQYRRIRDPR